VSTVETVDPGSSKERCDAAMCEHQVMRTTLDIDDDVVVAAKELAAGERRSLGSVISELARRGRAD